MLLVISKIRYFPLPLPRYTIFHQDSVIRQFKSGPFSSYILPNADLKDYEDICNVNLKVNVNANFGGAK